MVKIQIASGYNNRVKVRAFIDNKQYIIEIEDLQAMLEKQIEEKGYTESLKPRQQYPRLIINQ